MRYIKQLSRRRMLQGLSAGLLSVPFLRSVPSAEAAAHPTRFVVFFSPNDSIDPAHWIPGQGFALQPVMAPLMPHREKLLVIGPMTNEVRYKDPKTGGHGSTGHLLTGVTTVPYGSGTNEFWPGGPSLDQVLAAQMGMKSRVVMAGKSGTNGTSRITSSGASEPVHPVTDPRAAFDSILGDYTVAPDVLADQRERSKRVLDAVSLHANGLLPRLPSGDRQKLDAHLEHINALYDKLNAPMVANRTDPVAPDAVDATQNLNVPRPLSATSTCWCRRSSVT